MSSVVAVVVVLVVAALSWCTAPLESGRAAWEVKCRRDMANWRGGPL